MDIEGATTVKRINICIDIKEQIHELLAMLSIYCDGNAPVLSLSGYSVHWIFDFS
jgi:hypothetical protein